MLIHLHSQATTTPKVRAAIQASEEVGTPFLPYAYQWNRGGRG